MALPARLLRPRASGAAWTPALLGTQVAAWFDADDAATIALNGSNVSQWDDKSGNGRHVSQSTAADQPLYETNQLNGRPVITFDDSDTLFNTSSGASGVDDASFFVVMKFITGGANEDTPIGIGEAGQLRRVRMLYRGSNQTTLGYSNWGNDRTSSAYSLDIGGSYHIFASRQSGQSVQLRRDGSGTNYTLGNATLTVNSNNLFVGGILSNVSHPENRRTNGSFAEALVFYSRVSDATTALVERYLSNKWGVALV